MTTHLPVIGSTAASTEYVTARLDGPDRRSLWFDGNQKITAGNGSYAEPKPNAFSLPQIASCPGSTETCRASCYVHNLEAAQADLHAKYVENFETIKEILAEQKYSGPFTKPDDRPFAEGWAWLVAAWIDKNCRGGFRWHVSGDLFSLAYARWVAKVVERSPQVRHWIYTRSFSFTLLADSGLLALENLVVNLSADRDNYRQAVAFARRVEANFGKRLRICYFTPDGVLPDDLEYGAVIFPDYSLRPREWVVTTVDGADVRHDAGWFASLSPRYRQMVCPVDAHGKSEKRRCGPCDRCLR